MGQCWYFNPQWTSERAIIEAALSNSIRHSAHGRFFCHNGRVFLGCAHVRWKNGRFLHFLHCQCVRCGFCRVGCCVRSSAKNQGKEKKEVLGTSTCKSKTTERAVPHIVWRLAYPSKKNSLDILEWLATVPASFHPWLDPKLPTEILWWGLMCHQKKDWP
jgi:hypothetical protein